MALSVGAKLGPYEVLSPIGAGGMGEVYKARDTRLDRTVAIKVLPEHIAQRADLRARFEREARVVASLNHPHICVLHDIGNQDGSGYMVMEYLEGETLAARIGKGSLTLDQAIELAIQIAGALDRAHRAGVTHRDVKPQNIMLTRDGVKVLDFGLAKSMPKPGPAETTLTAALTPEGTVLGTPQYMAPEQFEGQEADARSDIWAFGAVLYEMVTGRRAFHGRSYASLVGAILAADPAPMSVKPLTPPWLERLVRRCLSKDPEQRYYSMHDIVLDLSAPLEEMAAGPTSTSRSPLVLAAGMLALVLAAVLAGVFDMRQRAPTSLLRFSIDLGPEAVSGMGAAGEFSPDGAHIAITIRGPDGRSQLALRRTDQDKLTPLAGTEGGFGPFFSPDGKWIGFLTPNQLKKIPIHGGGAVTLCDIADARGAAWAMGGFIVLASGTATGLSLIRDSGGAREVLTDPSTKGQRTHRWPQFLPGGETILFTAHTGGSGFDDAEIAALDLKTRTWKTVLRGGTFGRYLPSGHLVFMRQSTLYAVRLDLSRLETIGTPVPILDDIASNPFTGSGRFDAVVTPFGSGMFTYVSGKPRDARRPVVWLEESGKTQPLLPTVDSYTAPRLSYDGRLLAISAGSRTAGDLYIWDIQRQTRRQLTFTAQGSTLPVWALDGKHLIFVSHGNAGYTIWWIRTDGAGQPVKLLESPDALVPSDLSPDGLRLAYDVPGPGTGRDLWTLPLDLSDPENPKAGKPEIFLQTPKGEFTPVFSPDGRWIAYVSEDSGQVEVYVQPFPGPGAKWIVSTTGGANPIWSREGHQLFYATIGGRLMAADYEAVGDSFVPGRPRPWAASRTILQGASNYDLAPNGKRAAAVVSEESEGAISNPQLTVLLNFFDELNRRVP